MAEPQYKQAVQFVHGTADKEEMPFISPLFLFASFLAIVLSPCVALFSLAVYRAAKERPAKPEDFKLKAQIAALEKEIRNLNELRDETQVYANQMVERVRLLERLLIDERRARIADKQEIFSLRKLQA